MAATRWKEVTVCIWDIWGIRVDSMIAPPVEDRRRTTRRRSDGTCLEDAWISVVTTQRQMRKALRTPMDIKVQVELDDEEADSGDGSEEPLSAKETSKFRAISARMNFLSQDRPDFLFAGKECSRKMSDSTVGGVERTQAHRALPHRPAAHGLQLCMAR